MSDLSGRTVLVTGATSGIGLAASRRLAAMGAELLLVARDPARLEAAAAEVRAQPGSGPVTTHRCDLSSLASVRALAAAVLSRHPRLHVLVNNAGGVSATREVTEDGLERTFAVNHLAPYLLTRLLLERLRASAPARVVTVSSVAHRRADLDFADLQLARGYAIMRAYGRSKLSNVLFTRELSRLEAGTGLTANCLHPGVVATNIWSRAPGYLRPVMAVARHFMLTAEQGAEALVWLASSPEAGTLTGAYLEKGRVVEPAPLARDPALARRLWDESARLTGLAA
jgi:NAD(P)-dependent dehydrogenase (short-subunit alcohol dehydrogenase family)